ncbi:polysaccharide deacetylase family protein [Methylopila sp. M107]|uniref:polysaccharide deacetylase family protein n=1 Tax=Methylopila sp. M107 TaxID=1101190 RepID=UPI000377AFDF|nr:polysaccharide deacetylase family protein [Methylopila sp. M107]
MKPHCLLLAGLLALVAGGAGAVEFEPKLSFPAKQGERSVALTFDACAGGFDQRILDALLDGEIKSTIFVTDRWIRSNGANLKLLQSRPDLFQIENHGANHVPPVTDALTVFGIRTAGTVEAVKAEVEGGSRAIKAATGRKPVWYRGATARYSADALEAIRKLGFRIGGYSLNADKGASLPAGVVARRIERAKPGDVVIAHINQPHRPAGAGVAEGVRALKEAGWTFVKLEEVEPVEKNDRPLLVEPHETEDQPVSSAPKSTPKATPPKSVAAREPADKSAAPAQPGPGAAKSVRPPAAAEGEATPDPAEPAPESAEAADEQPNMQLKPKSGPGAQQGAGALFRRQPAPPPSEPDKRLNP